MSSLRVLVTDAALRQSLEIIRTLGRHGISVVACDCNTGAAGFYSKYCKARLYCPDPAESEGAFIEWLVRILQLMDIDVVMPVSDFSILAVSRFRKLVEPLTHFVVPNSDSIETAMDKGRTFLLASEIGIPSPKTVRIEKDSDLGEAIGKVGTPAVLKPITSSGSRGTCYVHSQEQLKENLQVRRGRYNSFLLQEYIPGHNAIGVSALFTQKSKPDLLFVHKRLREFPPSGGPSALCESTSEPRAAGIAMRLLEALRWQGVAMVEFKIDPRDNCPKLIEINPRFWGSLKLAVLCGVDFPLEYCSLAMGKTPIDRGPYPLGTRARFFFYNDILYFLSMTNKLSFLPTFFAFDARTHSDIDSHDLPPIAFYIYQAVRGLRNKELWDTHYRRF